MIPATSLLACEPVPYIAQMWMGPAINLSIVTNTLIALAIVVSIKSFLFACLARVGIARGFFMMVAANVVSTIPGLMVAASLSIPGLPCFVGFGLFILFTWWAGGYVSEQLENTSWRWLTKDNFVSLTFFALFISIITCVFMMNLRVEPGYILQFFVIKWFAFFMGLIASIALTIGWEGSVVACMAPAGADQNKLLRATVAANLWTFFGVFLIGALIALPHRLKRRSFLYYG